MRPVHSPLLLAVFLAACPGPAETPDAGSHRPDARALGSDATAEPGDAATAAGADASATAADASTAKPDAGASADAGPVTSCSDLPASSCFSNEDCAASELCKNNGDATTVLRCCVTGARGSKSEGSTCSADSECAFGRCEVRDDGAKFCSGYCESDLECSSWMQCSTFFKWCYPRDASAPPESCAQVSLSQCFLNDNCAADERCENKGTKTAEVLCCTVGARGTGAVGTACASELECSYGRCLGGLCSEACSLDVDPCPPATMSCNVISERCEPL